MDQSREKLQERIKRLTDRNQQELLRDIVDSTWQWSSGSTNRAVQERWITVGGQTVRGTTAQEKAPATTGGQTDGQGHTESQTTGAKGEVGPAGPKGDAGPQGGIGLTGPAGKDGTQGPGVTGGQLTDIVTTAGPTFTIPAFDVRLFDTPDFLGEIETFSFESQAISIPDDGALRYVCAYRSGGSASIVLKTKAEEYSINFSNTIPLWRVARYGSTIHQTNYDNAGDGLADKQEFMLLRTQPYRITYEGGLAGSLNGRALSLTGAKVFFGHRLMDVLPFSSAEGKVTAWYHSAGAWASSVIAGGLFPNSQYDNGTNLVNFSNSSKWGAIFVYRTVGDDKEVFYVYGQSESNNLAGAELIPVPPTPDLVQWHSILVGKILFLNGASSGTWEQYSTVTFQPATVTNHASLSGLVGDGPEYAHPNASQLSVLSAISSISTVGFVRRNSSGGWTASPFAWNDIASGHPSVTAGTGLTGGGSLTGSVTLAVSYGTAAGTSAQGNDARILNGQTAYGWGNHALAGYAMASSIPLASYTTPAALGTATVGTGTTWARADHVHAMPTAAQVGAEPFMGSGPAGYLLSTNGTARTWVASPTIDSLGGVSLYNQSNYDGTTNSYLWKLIAEISIDFSYHTHKIRMAASFYGAQWSTIADIDIACNRNGGTNAVVTVSGQMKNSSIHYFVDVANNSVRIWHRRESGNSIQTYFYQTAYSSAPYKIQYSTANAVASNPDAASIASGVVSRGDGVIVFGQLNGSVASFSSRCTQAGALIWDAGNLTGDQSAHYHSEDRKWANITGKPSFSYQPLENQRLSSYDEPTFASVTAFKLHPTDISTSEIGGPTNFWYSSFINKSFSNEVKVAYGGDPLTPFSAQNFIRISSLSSQCGYITGYQSGSQTFSIDGKYGSMSMIGGVGMFGSTPPPSKILVTGSKSGNAALASLISALVTFGMISDSTT